MHSLKMYLPQSQSLRLYQTVQQSNAVPFSLICDNKLLKEKNINIHVYRDLHCYNTCIQQTNPFSVIIIKSHEELNMFYILSYENLL